MAGTFEKDSFDWQFQLWQMRLAEWWERLFQPQQRQNDNFELPNWSFPEWTLRGLFWAIVLALATWAVWQLYSILSPYFGVEVLARRGRAAKGTPPKQQTVSQWLQRSRSFAQQGNYREACRALYYAALQKLDQTGVVPSQSSRTDGEYLRILQTAPNPRPYQVLIRTHERLCFSDAPITEENFDHCEAAYREVETP